LAVIGSTERHELNGELVRARVYPWGVIDIDNNEYSDLLHLQRLLISSFFVIGHEYVRQELYEKLWRPWFMSTNLDETLSKVSDEMPKIRELSNRGSITTTPITASHDVLPKMVHSPSAISTTLVKEKTFFFESRQASMSN
jgi:septin family protein